MQPVTPPNTTPSNLGPGLAKYRFGLLLPWLVFATSLAVTYQLWRLEQQRALHELKTGFDSRVVEAITEVKHRMQAYEQVLRGVGGLFGHDNSVRRDEFHDYVVRLQLEENYPGIQGVGYALIIPTAQKDNHIAAVRKQGFPDYTIKPEGGREIYTSVIYLEPLSGSNLLAFGYDMYSDLIHPRAGDPAPGARHAAMQQARDTGTISISGKVRLLMETDKDIQAGVLMYLPVYKKGSLHNTLSERRANIIGWAYAPFRMGNLMNNILDRYTREFDIEIYDGKKISDDALLHRTNNGHESVRAQHAQFKTFKHVDIGGHTWTISIRSLPGFEAKLRKEKAQIIAYAGIGISMLLALLTWLLVSGRERAIKTAVDMNRELIKSETSLRALIDSASEGIWAIDANQQTTRVNRALLDMLGATEHDMLAKPIYHFFDEEDFATVQKLVEESLGPGASHHFEMTLKRSDSSKICCQFSTATIRDEMGNGIGSFALITDITERKKAEQALLESRSQMESLSMFLQTALENERKRIARELHDELGQTMTALHFDLKWLDENINAQESDIHNKLYSMKALVSRTVDSIRRISEDLRPGMLDDLGLAAAIEHYVVKFSEKSGIECALFMNDTDFDLDEQVATALFRIVQEALTNVARHSGANHVTIRLQELEDKMLLIVQDNGRGLPPTPNINNRKTYGLMGMRERVKMIAGTLDIFNEAGAGARIEACVPKHVTIKAQYDNQDLDRR